MFIQNTLQNTFLAASPAAVPSGSPATQNIATPLYPATAPMPVNSALDNAARAGIIVIGGIPSTAGFQVEQAVAPIIPSGNSTTGTAAAQTVQPGSDSNCEDGIQANVSSMIYSVAGDKVAPGLGNITGPIGKAVGAVGCETMDAVAGLFNTGPDNVGDPDDGGICTDPDGTGVGQCAGTDGGYSNVVTDPPGTCDPNSSVDEASGACYPEEPGPLGQNGGGSMPADDGTGPIGPNADAAYASFDPLSNGGSMPADDGTSPVGPRSDIASASFANANVANMAGVAALSTFNAMALSRQQII